MHLIFIVQFSISLKWIGFLQIWAADRYRWVQGFPLNYFWGLTMKMVLSEAFSYSFIFFFFSKFNLMSKLWFCLSNKNILISVNWIIVLIFNQSYCQIFQISWWVIINHYQEINAIKLKKQSQNLPVKSHKNNHLNQEEIKALLFLESMHTPYHYLDIYPASTFDIRYFYYDFQNLAGTFVMSSNSEQIAIANKVY